jgi:CRP/FNR family transcriptional regulator, cyclic AMP receptor protein
MVQLRLRKDERVELLRRVELFSARSTAELGRISALTTEVTAKAGQLLTTKGEPGLEFFVVEGRAKASRKDVNLATLGPGSSFGELALLDGGPRTATVVAATDMRLLVLSRREFTSIYGMVPSVASKIIAEPGARLRKTDDLLDRTPAVRKRFGSWSL